MNRNTNYFLFVAAILTGIGLALIFSEIAALKELPARIQIFLGGTTSTELSDPPGTLLTMLIAFAIGLSMVVTPCFLPILFAFAPTLKIEDKNNTENWITNLFLYSLGLILVGALVGAVAGLLGKQLTPLLGTLFSSATQTAVVVFSLVGFIVFYFGLVEFGFIKPIGLFRRPFHTAQRKSLGKRGYYRSFAVGIAMGGALGVGCPFPTYHAVLLWAAIIGSTLYGALLGGVLALGRVFPLLIFGLLVRSKVSPKKMADWIANKAETVHLVNGISLVTLGSFSLAFWLALIGPKAF